MRRMLVSERKTSIPRTAQQYFDRFLPSYLKSQKQRTRATQSAGRYHVIVTGNGGGEWTIDLQTEAPSVKRGLQGRPTRIMRITAEDLSQLLRDPRTASAVFNRGLEVIVTLPYYPPAVVSADAIQLSLILALMGTFIKVDHMDNNPRSPSGAWSFVQFNELLHARGLMDHDLDVPIKEINPGNAGQLLSLAVGGWYVVDRIRFLVNNLRTTLGFDTMSVALEPGAIAIGVDFLSNTPTLQGEGNAYLAPLLGIPLGWEDSAFPDVNIQNFRINLKLLPFVTSNGDLALHDIDVEFAGDLETDVITKNAEQDIRDAIADAFRNNFNTPVIRAALASALAEIIQGIAGQASGTWTDISVDSSGITVWGL